MQVFIEVSRERPRPSKILYGPFSKEDAEGKLATLGWTAGIELINGYVWHPPRIEGKLACAVAIIIPLVAEFPQTIEVEYKDRQTTCEL